ncbi:MAG: phosphotransferase [Actinomycetota bacterium]
MTALAVPSSFDDVTVSWLNAALRQGGAQAVEVTAVEVEPLGAGVGLLGDLARLHLATTNGAGPARLIVKLPTTDPGGREVGAMLGAWAREVAFYRELVPQAPGIAVPHCYHAAGDPAAERWVVLLEDCGPGTGAYEPRNDASRREADAAVVALAAFHARWWGSPTRFSWMPGFDRGGIGGLTPAWLDSHPVFLERFHHLIPEPTGSWLTRFAPTLSTWSERAATEPLTIVHADYRLANLVFNSDDDGSVTMIDWQTALVGPAAMDLSCFIATSLTVDDRRSWETDLIDRYAAELATNGVDVDRQWLDRSYDENLLWWMGQFANNLARLRPDPDTQRSLDAMIERTFTAALDRDVGRLLD